jgi:hypothetical protein
VFFLDDAVLSRPGTPCATCKRFVPVAAAGKTLGDRVAAFRSA